jgi:two-component system, chemotaxis family, protein-glutamate methylesterase/glutaminase
MTLGFPAGEPAGIQIQAGTLMIRLLIVDDSVTARTLLAAIFSSDPEIQVVGQAANGLEAVEMTRKLRPDVVTMDIQMPRMDGFEATKEIMIEAPTPIVIISSTQNLHSMEMSMNALRAGALAVLEKPAGVTIPGFDEVAHQLIVQVKSMSQVKVVRHWRSNNPAARAAPALVQKRGRARVIAVASSTGGPAALQILLCGLPADLPVPILVAQHISHGFIAGLADWLSKTCPLQVKVAEAGETLKNRTVYLAPDDRHLGVSTQGQVVLSADPAIGGFRPSGTYLFASVAKIYGASAAVVILTGMGEDGVAGLRNVRQAGGRIFAQDEETSVVFGMPGAAVAAGLADEVLPLDQIAGRLRGLVE